MGKQLTVAHPRPISEALLMFEPTCTVRNTNGGWWLIHAPLDPEYSLLLAAVPRGVGGLESNALCRVQSAMAGKFVTVEPVWCIREGGYWYLRNTSNLGVTRPAGYGRWSSLQACMNAALAWCMEAPQRREAVVRTGAINEAAQRGEALPGVYPAKQQEVPA